MTEAGIVAEVAVAEVEAVEVVVEVVVEVAGIVGYVAVVEGGVGHCHKVKC
jgi:hypothetical protein